MENAIELPPTALCRRCDPDRFSFQTTDDLEDLSGIVGQSRAVSAVEFGVGIGRDGYNIFAMGAPGTGKENLVRHHVDQRARERAVPPDLCYVHDFEVPHNPRVLLVPAGTGAALRKDMDALVDEFRTAIQAAFESEEYQRRRHAIEDEFKERPEKELGEIQERAKEKGLRLLRTPLGLGFAPVRDDEVVSGEAFKELPQEEREEIKESVEGFHREAQRVLRQMPRWERERHEKVRTLNREVTNVAVVHLIDELRKKYVALPKVIQYLDAVQEDVIENAQDFVSPDEAPIPAILMGAVPRHANGAHSFRRYRVNVLVDRSGAEGAPVVYENHPNYDNLIGRIEHISQLGALVTDHTLVKAGALHRANGGYLILEFHKLMRAPYAWEALKRSLQSRKLRVESLGQALSLLSTVSLEPEPVDLDVQVVLLGEPMWYYLLCHYDPDFSELFKVVADFDQRMDATDDVIQRYAQLIATLARKYALRAFDRSAVARLVEHSARIAEDQTKLTARIGALADLLKEADYWAGVHGDGVVRAIAVQQAIDAQIHRADRYRERYREEVVRGTIRIDTSGAAVGQVNGLSVVTAGNFAFGHPTRITARTRLGEGEVVDIEREIELGGPIHSKGVLILEGFLGARYAPDRPLSLSGSLVFEQTYGGVEGDSASTAELLALLSSIAGVPLSQNIAVTGSVNQHGEVQAIGGVNEKIEGFFDICRTRGLTGDQGVIIPRANVEHLMLEREVVEAVDAGQFHIYPIDAVDQGVEILSGMPARDRDESGEYPEGSFNRLVETRLTELSEERRAFRAPPESEDDA